nr:hypothetical protein CFP56_42143 [Quercus suber]
MKAVYQSTMVNETQKTYEQVETPQYDYIQKPKQMLEPKVVEGRTSTSFNLKWPILCHYPVEHTRAAPDCMLVHGSAWRSVISKGGLSSTSKGCDNATGRIFTSPVGRK